MKKVLLVTEYINHPFDEGIKKTVYNLFLDLDVNYELQVICRFGFEKKNIHIVQTNALFLSKKVKKIIRRFDPEVLIYLPFQSSTLASYLRLRILTLFTNFVSNIFIALQPKGLKKWEEVIMYFMKPKYALTPSPELENFWSKQDINNKMLPLLTDLNIYKPVSSVIKNRLRVKYNLPLDTFIISHMGHLNEGRNLRSLVPLQTEGNQVVIVASSSTPVDAQGSQSLKDELKKNGIIIIDRYIENIEEVYQLSDVYIFPVVTNTGSIGMPLSIMEARGCGIPVITTDYGSLKQYLGDDNNSIWYRDPKEFSVMIGKIKSLPPRNFSQTKIEYINKEFYTIIHSAIDNS